MESSLRPRYYLCINIGSSSLKFAHYCVDTDGHERRLAQASASNIAQADARIEVNGASKHCPLKDHHAALLTLLDTLDIKTVDAVGHRIVHGGEHAHAMLVTPTLREELQGLIPLAPLHLPAALNGIDIIRAHWPDLPQVACFDTAFHHTLPELARHLPLPDAYTAHGIRRYGFHGLSYEYIVRSLGERAHGRVIIAHLGNGASLCALRDGRSVETTMGLTPSGGVMMGTRSGDLDPGVLLYLLREKGFDAAQLEQLIDHQSGLLGVSGVTSDMAQLLQNSDAKSHLAVDLFAYEVSKAIGALTAVLAGIDRLVFTGGIGEHAAAVRARICHKLAHLGIRLDENANQAHHAIISTPHATCTVEVIPTDEDAMIARHIHATLHPGTA